ncbi:TIGR03560 family F420-dependent LLM class oxidoreductase [Pseudonocardia endophytica]|uniref:F420-dependent oxidoreductase-like protein n=1 Tax=Pseudonocardia endophytica TaxID=401976 RepID=A0A4R1I3K0_PSEEN|nr:TIGR03560 family F420-dependent LLM class oxidoreductase [Pseudonocardia endophytica]TCK24572.1 F420-dependent oxidoreductase-like protein [Pseudonocardia endophytica]
MHPLRFGLKLSQAATIDVLRDVWRIADDGGFDHCWNMDHLAGLGGDDSVDIFEAWTLLAGMAVATTRVRIGCSVTGNTYRHPGLLAKAAVTVDHLSGGRLEFGIGAGWAENEHTMMGLPFGTVGDRADRLAEALPILRSLWTEDRTTAHGTHYDLTDAVAEPKPVQRPHPPIWIGGTGRRRTLRTAAEHAAVWNAPGGEPELVAELSGVLDGHCAAVGRDPAEIRRSVQVRVPDDVAALPAQIAAYTEVGVTEIILIVAGDDPAGAAHRVAEILPDLRSDVPTGGN